MEDDKTLRVWLTLLLLAESDGIVRVSVPGLAKEACVTFGEAKASLAKLEAPDAESQSQKEEGRRILRLGDDTVWMIVNFEMYRKIRNAESRREYMREYMRDYRGKQKVLTVNTCKPLLAQEEEEEEESNEESKTPKPPKGASKKTPNKYPDDFAAFLKVYPKKKKPLDALKAWKQTEADRPELEKILAAVESQSLSPEWTKDGGQFIPYPASWLRAGSWEDEGITKRANVPDEDWRVDYFGEGHHAWPEGDSDA